MGISDVIRNDLNCIEATYRQTVAADPDERDPKAFVGQLMRHLIAEEIVVTPALEARLAHEKWADRARRDNKSIKEKLRRLLDFRPDEESCVSALRAVWVDMEPHIEESAGEMDWLQERVTAQDSEVMSSDYDEVKRLVDRRCRGEASSGLEVHRILETPPGDLEEYLGREKEA